MPSENRGKSERARERGDAATQRPILPGLVLREILCWVGSDEKADATIQLAQNLALQSGSRCQVIMGMDTPFRRTDGSFTSSTSQQPLTPESIAEAQRKLVALYGPDLHPVVVPGHPITEVRRYAANRQVDLIVLGEQALRVEEAYGERLADNAPCPLLILVPPAS